MREAFDIFPLKVSQIVSILYINTWAWLINNQMQNQIRVVLRINIFSRQDRNYDQTFAKCSNEEEDKNSRRKSVFRTSLVKLLKVNCVQFDEICVHLEDDYRVQFICNSNTSIIFQFILIFTAFHFHGVYIVDA